MSKYIVGLVYFWSKENLVLNTYLRSSQVRKMGEKYEQLKSIPEIWGRGRVSWI